MFFNCLTWKYDNSKCKYIYLLVSFFLKFLTIPNNLFSQKFHVDSVQEDLRTLLKNLFDEVQTLMLKGNLKTPHYIWHVATIKMPLSLFYSWYVIYVVLK